MSNLMDMYVDKDTGKVRAKKSGKGKGAEGYLHEQDTAALLWEIKHNADTTLLIQQIYDENMVQVYPDSVTIVDKDEIRVRFNVPQAGVAHLIFFKT